MPREAWQSGSLPDLAERRDALRQAANLPGADSEALLEAALTELDAAIEALAERAVAEDAGQPQDGSPDAIRAERRLMRAAFQQAPAALFLLERDGTVRRANVLAGKLIGASPGYATGKALATFVDLPSRAAVQTQLAAAARTGKPRRVECRLLGSGGPADVTLSAEAIAMPGDPPLLVVAASPPGTGRGPAPGPAREAEDDTPPDAIKAATRRMDMVTAVTRLLLDNSTFSEAVTLQRCARLLAGTLASWVIVDVERNGRLRRQFTVGPRGGTPESAARAVRGTEPGPESLPGRVHASRKAELIAHADDVGVLGADEAGTPLLMLLGATSVLSVPITDGTHGYGALTLVRKARDGQFGVADLGLAQELGGHLAIAMGVDRMFRRRSEVAEALQASLLPAGLPSVPGLDLAAAYIAASDWQEISGDFYDVFPMRDGWGIAVGDVCGKGEDAAAMTAAARHAIRALAHYDPDPAQVLRGANEVLLAGDYEDRFVTVKLGYLRRTGSRLRLLLGSSGHPGPVVLRADGRVEVVEGQGLPLGLFAGAEPSTEKVTLDDGDLIFFYTDGVTDARGADLSYFEDRLADELAAVAGSTAAETVRAIQDLVTEFSGGELRDDMTILAVKVTGSAGTRSP